MRNYTKGLFIGKMVVFGTLAATALTFALMLLWNWLMPAIFGLTVITFWQALGLLALSKILFGRGGKPRWRDKEKSRMHKEQFMKRFKKSRMQPDVESTKEMSHED